MGGLYLYYHWHGDEGRCIGTPKSREEAMEMAIRHLRETEEDGKLDDHWTLGGPEKLEFLLSREQEEEKRWREERRSP